MYLNGFKIYDWDDHLFDEELILLPEEPEPDKDWDDLVFPNALSDDDAENGLSYTL